MLITLHAYFTVLCLFSRWKCRSVKGNILEPPAAQSYSQCVVNEKSMTNFTIVALWNILGSLREISTLEVLGVPIICQGFAALKLPLQTYEPCYGMTLARRHCWICYTNSQSIVQIYDRISHRSQILNNVLKLLKLSCLRLIKTFQCNAQTVFLV